MIQGRGEMKELGMTLKFLDHQVTRYKVVSFTIRVNINEEQIWGK